MSPYSGHTCGGRAKGSVALFLLGVLLAFVPVQSGLTHAAFGAQTTTTTTTRTTTTTTTISPPQSISAPSFYLGFGPSSMSRVADGTPVYTVGDSIWAESAYTGPVPVSVTSPGVGAAPAIVVVTSPLSPQSITPLYTFTPKDVDGIWNVTVASAKGAVVIPVHFVNPANHTLSLDSVSYSLSGGNMSISARANLGDSYDQEVCAAGSATSEGLTLNLPTGMHENGSVTLTPGNPFKIVAAGNVSEPFSFSFELYHPYALDQTKANSLVVENLMTAASRPVTFTSAGTANTTVSWSLPPREGRYELRAFIQNSTNVETFQSRILVINASSWVSLAETCRAQVVQSATLAYPASLMNGQENWPRNFYVMYRTFGVEGVSSIPVKANLSSVTFSATPWNRPLQDIKVNVSPNPDVVASSQAGSSLFLLTSRYPVSVGYSLDIAGGHGFEQGSVTINTPFSTKTTTFALAELVVQLVSDQNSPSTLEVTGPKGLDLLRNLSGNSNQTATFVLPAGSYSVTARQAGNSQSAQVKLSDGVSTLVTLNFSTFLTFEIILVVTALVATVGNVLYWFLRSRNLSSRMATSSKVPS